MIRSLLVVYWVAWAAVLGVAAEPAQTPAEVSRTDASHATEPASAGSLPDPESPSVVAPESTPRAGVVKIHVIRVDGEVSVPSLYIVRNGVKQAEAAEADWVVIDIETPGGRLDVTLDIMEVLGKFSGRSAAFVNKEAVSAGAFIAAATDSIYFAPGAVIGASAPVTGEGKDIETTMRQKIVSFLGAKVRAISEEHPRRGQVITAMMDADYELKIGEEVIKAPGSLLSLTATEAMKVYGDPAEPLLGAGIFDSVDLLCQHLAGSARVERQDFQQTWSLDLARWLNAISPVLMSIGVLLLMIEFKTPGFGVVGISGIALIMVVLFGHHVAGLSGKEPMLLFLAGAALVFVEVLFFPGTIVVALTGFVLMLASLVWGMTDIWPGKAFELTPEMFVRPVMNLGIGLVLTVVLGVLLAKFLPRGWVWDRIILQRSITGVSSGAAVLGAPGDVLGSLIGSSGVAVTDLFPSGIIDVAGRRLEARTEVGSIRTGTPVRIVRKADFVYIVEEIV